MALSLGQVALSGLSGGHLKAQISPFSGLGGVECPVNAGFESGSTVVAEQRKNSYKPHQTN
jgi:hypothetical protein